LDFDSCAAEESRGGAVLVVAGGVGEISHSVFFAGELWESVWVEDGGSSDESAPGFFCDGRDWTRVGRSGGGYGCDAEF
jgi:hypothetical protein